MAKKHDVYMPVIIGDWLKGTRGMKASVRGVYLSLLLYQWDNGFIPESMEELTLIDPEVGSVWVTLWDKFKLVEPGKLQNEKLEEVRNYFSKQKKNGEKGGRKKQNNPSSNPNDNPNGNLHNGIGIGIEFKEEEGVVGETFEPVPESLIGEMKTAWKISNPGTFIDETENAILLELSTKIKKWMALPGQVTDHENKVVILRRWGEVVRHCSQDPHLVKYSISQVNKHFSSVTQSFKSNQNGSKSRKGAADQRPVIDESPTSSGVL